MDQGPQSSSATLSTLLCILARRTIQRCQLFLQMHPPQHFLYPQTVLQHLPTLKDPGAQFISATPPIPLLLLQCHPPPPIRHLSVFQLVQVLSSPCTLAVKDPGTQCTFSAALSIPLLLHQVLLAPRVMRHQHRFLPDLPLPQRLPVAPWMCNMIEYFRSGSKFYVEPLSSGSTVKGQHGQYSPHYLSIFYGQLDDLFTIVLHNGRYMDVITQC